MTQDFLNKVYDRAGIPETLYTLRHESLILDKRAEEVWKNVLQRVSDMKNGVFSGRGLILSGTQGTGKSTILYFLARAHIKSWLKVNPPLDLVGVPSVPFYIRYFKRWVRDEFAVDGKYNFNLLDNMLNSEAIFLDDLTFDTKRESFGPVREFIELLAEELSRKLHPPTLYITTNNDGKDWDAMLGPQIVDRLTGKKLGLCEVITCNWTSFRKE